MQNRDEKCFAYAILAKVLHERRVPNLHYSNRYTPDIWNLFDFSGIRYPTPFSDIKIFERKNGASVNVYGIEYDLEHKPHIYPIRISENFVRVKHFDLLYIQRDISENELNGHYCLITDLARLVVSQFTTNSHAIFICRCCLTHFGGQDLLDSHEILCHSHEPINSQMPDHDRANCEFKNRRFQQEIPYIIFADLESALKPFMSVDRDPNLNVSFTDKKHIHEATSYCYYIVSRHEADDDTNYRTKLYRGLNAIQHFWENLREDIERIGEIYRNIAPI